jgi:hypothetical protein
MHRETRPVTVHTRRLTIRETHDSLGSMYRAGTRNAEEDHRDGWTRRERTSWASYCARESR